MPARSPSKDTDVWTLKENALADFRLNTIGFVFQDFHLFPNLTTVENVAIPLVLKRRDWNESIKEAEKYLESSGSPRARTSARRG
jgi:putative ABC transport system ATP-binding protein